jgi:hypothetical protein
MSNGFNEFIDGFREDKDPKEDIIKVLNEIDRYKNSISYEQLYAIIPNDDILNFHLRFQEECEFIKETEVAGERIFETTELGKHILCASEEYSALYDMGAPDVDRVIIDESVEEKILWNVYENPEEKRRGDLYGYVNVLGDERVNIEVLDAGFDDDRKEYKGDLEVVGYWRSAHPVGYLLYGSDVDDLLQGYGENYVVMCVDSKEPGESAYQFWGANTEKKKGRYFRIPHDVRIGE